MVIRLEQSFLRAKQKFDPMTKESNRRFKRSFEGIILCSTSRAGHPQLCMAESGDQSHTTQAAQIPRETATFTKIFFFFQFGKPGFNGVYVPGDSYGKASAYNAGESECEVAQSYPTLCDPMDCSPRGSSVHGILQARTLEWVAIFSSRGSS